LDRTRRSHSNDRDTSANNWEQNPDRCNAANYSRDSNYEGSFQAPMDMVGTEN
jgi:hypothetical protein